MTGNETAQFRKKRVLIDPAKLVIIGSSAGGIQALMKLVTTLPPNFPAPIILAQHLAPDRESKLVKILQKKTSLIIEFTQLITHLESGRIYVTPPGHNVFIEDGLILLREDNLGRPKPSINLLLITAAHAYHKNLIAVILTGSGSNGALGAQEVKKMGGTVIIENPMTAEFPFMPSAVPPGVVDFKADIEQIGPLISSLISKNGKEF